MSDSPSRSRGETRRLGQRYKWMISCISEAFNMDELNIEQEFRNPDTYDRIAAAFQVGGPRRLIVSIKTTSDAVDTKSSGSGSIVISDGVSVSMSGSKVCYFVKTSDIAINTDISPNIVNMHNNFQILIVQKYLDYIQMLI